MSQFVHQPVLLHETIGELVTKKDGIYVDCTLGGGGHTETILKTCPEARVIGIDQDMEAIRASAERLAPYGDRAIFVWNNFRNLSQVLAELGIAFLILATILNVGWLALGVYARKFQDDIKWAKAMFVYSLQYLTVLFVSMVIVTLI